MAGTRKVEPAGIHPFIVALSQMNGKLPTPGLKVGKAVPIVIKHYGTIPGKDYLVACGHVGSNMESEVQAIVGMFHHIKPSVTGLTKEQKSVQIKGGHLVYTPFEPKKIMEINTKALHTNCNVRVIQ